MKLKALDLARFGLWLVDRREKVANRVVEAGFFGLGGSCRFCMREMAFRMLISPLLRRNTGRCVLMPYCLYFRCCFFLDETVMIFFM